MAYTSPAAGFCVAGALFVCGLTGLPTPPSQVPPTSGSLTLGAAGSTSFAPGEKLILSGDGFAGKASITVAIYSSPQVLAQAVSDSAGHVVATVTLPTDLRGRHTLVALGRGPSNQGRALESAVDFKMPTATTPSLASTGFDAAAWILGAIGMIIAGFALIRTVVFRRRFVPSAAGRAPSSTAETI